MENLKEIQLSSERLYKGRILDLYLDEVQLADGKTSKREYIKHLGAACVVPVDNEGNVIMVKQFRYPFSRVLSEVPAGKLDSAAESHLVTAKRELLEETGYVAESMIYLGEYYPTCAYSDEIIHMYLATGLQYKEQQLDEGEFIGVEKIPLDAVVEEIMKGNIRDGKTQTAILKAYYYLKNNK